MGDNLGLCSWKSGFMVHLFLNLCPKVDQPVQGMLGNCCGPASARHAGKSVVDQLVQGMLGSLLLGGQARTGLQDLTMDRRLKCSLGSTVGVREVIPFPGPGPGVGGKGGR